MHELKDQTCPVCGQNKLVLREDESEVPFFGKVHLYSMTCENCKYHKSDVEAAEKKEPVKYSLDITSQDDMKIRVVKSSEATIKVPHITTVEPGVASQGYVTNVEGILTRIKASIELARDSEEELDVKKKAKRLLKKIQKTMWGRESMKLIIEDPSGNSAIISEKAVKTKLN